MQATMVLSHAFAPRFLGCASVGLIGTLNPKRMGIKRLGIYGLKHQDLGV